MLNEGGRKLPITLLEDDDVASPADPVCQIATDLLDVLLHAFAPGGRVAVIDTGARYRPLVAEVLELEESVEREADLAGRKIRGEELLAPQQGEVNRPPSVSGAEPRGWAGIVEQPTRRRD